MGGLPGNLEQRPTEDVKRGTAQGSQGHRGPSGGCHLGTLSVVSSGGNRCPQSKGSMRGGRTYPLPSSYLGLYPKKLQRSRVPHSNLLWVQILAASLISSVTLGRWPPLSIPQLLHLYREEEHGILGMTITSMFSRHAPLLRLRLDTGTPHMDFCV